MQPARRDAALFQMPGAPGGQVFAGVRSLRALSDAGPGRVVNSEIANGGSRSAAVSANVTHLGETPGGREAGGDRCHGLGEVCVRDTLTFFAAWVVLPYLRITHHGPRRQI